MSRLLVVDDDIQMLAAIRYRGEQPRTIADWRYLYESIQRTIRGGEADA